MPNSSFFGRQVSPNLGQGYRADPVGQRESGFPRVDYIQTLKTEIFCCFPHGPRDLRSDCSFELESEAMATVNHKKV